MVASSLKEGATLNEYNVFMNVAWNKMQISAGNENDMAF